MQPPPAGRPMLGQPAGNGHFYLPPGSQGQVPQYGGPGRSPLIAGSPPDGLPPGSLPNGAPPMRPFFPPTGYPQNGGFQRPYVVPYMSPAMNPYAERPYDGPMPHYNRPLPPAPVPFVPPLVRPDYPPQQQQPIHHSNQNHYYQQHQHQQQHSLPPHPHQRPTANEHIVPPSQLQGGVRPQPVSVLPPPEPRYPQQRRSASSVPPSSPPSIPGSRRSSGVPQPPPRFDSEHSSLHKRDSEDVRIPMVYPALLSKVADAFRVKVPLSTHTKDSLEYTDCFVGRDAVDTIAFIIKTTDRNLALLLGRALDAQKFFHDVTYNHRLRDSSNELYKFQARTVTPLVADIPDATADPEEGGLPNGVFTLLTDCYSPTCTRDRLCYSIACPRRLEQQTRLLSQTSSQLQRSPSRASLADKDKKGHLWSTSVPKEIVESVSATERKRQEIIFETIQTEREFVADLELIQSVFVEPLRKSDIIDPSRRDGFINDVFLNLRQLHTINSKLLRKLVARQQENKIVDKIGDIFMSVVDTFEAYVDYGARQVYAKSALDHERAMNPEFAKFLQDCERKPECRKLPIQSFLARPTTRVGRYPLLLRSALDKSPENHPDRALLPQAISVIKDVLSKINREAGRAENLLKLHQLQNQLIFNPGEPLDLGLSNEGRTIVREGSLVLRRNGNEIDVQVFLFDHVLLLTKKKKNGFYKVYKRPIPLEMLHILEGGTAQRRGSGLFSSGHKSSPSTSLSHNSTVSKQMNMVSSRPSVVTPPGETATKGYPFSLVHLGRAGTTYTLYAANQADRRSWRDAIEQQKLAVTEKKRRFEIVTMLDTAFPYTNKVNSSVSMGNKLILGTDNGLYVGPSSQAVQVDADKLFKRVIDLEKIQQVDVLPEHDMLTLLAEKHLITFPLDVLDVTEQEANLVARKGKKVASHISFFKQGLCDNRILVSAVRITALNSTVKVFEPQDVGSSKKRGKFGKFLLGDSDSMKMFKEFYVPTESSSIHYLRSKICVGCTKGFEIVDLNSLDTQGLLDPTDENLDFVHKRSDVKPISVFRIRDGDFLLCYNEFAFYVDRLGRKSHRDWMIYWTGYPNAFALVPPYIIAFEPSFIEVRHVDSGELQQIIPTQNMRTLNTNPEFLHCVMDSALDFQHIFRLQPVGRF
ncbi:uncharacterized protein SPPG_08691 [Spizellomyces punctatus DAOM BR117]|uniref:Uncharacterized protein n=1 Tax=Spizellomyces punctatus (strain DAOM BR117) TaxID=645134 RepID=A0A0L0H5D2_SPIPD|nr:uncharacterized protein SPPG_08691 [Spizellomyces punctatus DAOM BR117]KNC95938.1 hypothetical protein SPPG_08691 [Spizellomyces punctatus DAOM BR117]|eukprot:XP_016603978.1 hypothetical protein SPPG_08691 [Spizellomyces punctatus DAOM BR117]